MYTKDIQTVIFDLGGVIIDLAVEKTIQEFCLLSGLCADDVKKHYMHHEAFVKLEKGQMHESDFRNSLKMLFSPNDIHDHQIDAAWNAMLVDLPGKKLDMLMALKDRFNVMILSNTNTIHIDYVYQVMMPKVCKEKSLDAFAHKVYYSHLLGMRKPDAEIFQHVLAENNLTAAQTLFLDDNLENIRAAQSLGIKTVHVTHPEMVGGIFN